MYNLNWIENAHTQVSVPLQTECTVLVMLFEGLISYENCIPIGYYFTSIFSSMQFHLPFKHNINTYALQKQFKIW